MSLSTETRCVLTNKHSRQRKGIPPAFSAAGHRPVRQSRTPGEVPSTGRGIHDVPALNCADRRVYYYTEVVVQDAVVGRHGVIVRRHDPSLLASSSRGLRPRGHTRRCRVAFRSRSLAALSVACCRQSEKDPGFPGVVLWGMQRYWRYLQDSSDVSGNTVPERHAEQKSLSKGLGQSLLTLSPINSLQHSWQTPMSPQVQVSPAWLLLPLSAVQT